MGFTFTLSIRNPVPANQPFTFSYTGVNDGPDDPGHEDRVQVWDSGGGQPVNEVVMVTSTLTGESYVIPIDVPALAPGHYDVSVTSPVSIGTGSTIIVQ